MPWPPQFSSRESCPSLDELLVSTDAEIQLQAIYLTKTANLISKAGFKVEGILRPMNGIVIPLIVVDEAGIGVIAYTYAFPWDHDSIARFSAWLEIAKGFVPESIPIVVASLYDSDDVKEIPGVSALIQLPKPAQGRPREHDTGGGAMRQGRV